MFAGIALAFVCLRQPIAASTETMEWERELDMRATRYSFLFVLALVLVAAGNAFAQSGALQFVAVDPPCRLIDTRSGSPLQGGVAQNFQVGGNCGVPADAAAYSMNVTVQPHGTLNYLTIWPAGESQPVVSTLNSYDGRIKANAAIVPAGDNPAGAVSAYATNTTDLILDIDGYFTTSTTSSMAFYPLPPCRLADTRQGSPLQGGVPQNFSIGGVCGIPANAQAFSLNVTAVPINNAPVGYVTAWPAGQSQPATSTLNAPTGTVTANAALVQSGTGGQISVFAYNTTNLLLDTNGYFAPPGSASQLALYTLTPCRVLDTRPPQGNGAFNGTLSPPINVVGSPCSVPQGAGAYIMNATVVPQGSLGYLTLWPDGQGLPVVSTLNAYDGAVTSNMAIVPTTNGSIDAYAAGTTNLIVDIFSYMAPAPLTVTTTSLPGGSTGMPYNAQLAASGGEPPYSWTLNAGSGPLPPGLSLSDTGVISGTPTVGGTFSFTVKVTDTQSTSVTANLSITISAGGLVITTTQLPTGTQNSSYSATLGVAGGTPPYTWSLALGTLPTGLNLAPTTGVISGTPTGLGTSNFTVQVQDSLGVQAQATLSITINPSTSDGALSGNYAFSFNGFSNGQPVFMAGSFISDGQGNITSGVLDLNIGHGTPQSGSPFTGTYDITSDHNGLGTMTFNVPSLPGLTFNFHIAVSSGGNGQLIQDNTDPATRGSGAFYVQNANDFGLPPSGKTFTEGTIGADQAFARYAKAGVFTVATAGAVTGGTEDVNDNGTLTNRQFTGQFLPPNLQTGRGQVAFDFPNGVTNNYAYYVVFKGQYIILGTDPVNANDPLTLGTVLVQTGSGFSNGSLSGNSIYEASALAPNNGSPQAVVTLGLLDVLSAGSAQISLDQNQGGTLTQQQVSQGTFNIASNGKVTLSGFGGTPPIIYLYNTNQGFAVGQDSSVAQGILEPQTAIPPYSNFSIFGTYLGGTIGPVEVPVEDAVSYVLADGNGNLNGVQFYSGTSGSGNRPISDTYLVDNTGRAVLSSGGNQVGVMYVVSGKKVVLLPTGSYPVLSSFSLGVTN